MVETPVYFVDGGDGRQVSVCTYIIPLRRRIGYAVNEKGIGLLCQEVAIAVEEWLEWAPSGR